MKYYFKVNADAFKIFDETIKDIDIEILKEHYSDFKITYNPELDEGNNLAIVEVLEGINDQHQILMHGFNSETKEYEAIAYWFVGNNNDYTEYIEGINVLNKLLNNYKID